VIDVNAVVGGWGGVGWGRAVVLVVDIVDIGHAGNSSPVVGIQNPGHMGDYRTLLLILKLLARVLG